MNNQIHADSLAYTFIHTNGTELSSSGGPITPDQQLGNKKP